LGTDTLSLKEVNPQLRSYFAEDDPASAYLCPVSSPDAYLPVLAEIYVSNDNSVFERVHECLCKRGGRGHKAEVSAGQIDDLEAQLPRQHLIRLVWKLVLRITSPASTIRSACAASAARSSSTRGQGFPPLPFLPV
jgi:hypothetical protein